MPMTCQDVNRDPVWYDKYECYCQEVNAYRLWRSQQPLIYLISNICREDQVRKERLREKERELGLSRAQILLY